MNRDISVTGMVLSSMPIGDYDRRIVILTRERGKIAAFARGARRPSSMLLKAINPFSFGTFQLYEGKDSYNLRSAEIKEYFSEFRTDLTGACYGMYFLDVAGFISREGMRGDDTLLLLYMTLKALSIKDIPNALVRAVYEIRTIYGEGEGPRVSSCVICGKTEELKFISGHAGGALCADCRQKASDAFPISYAALYALWHITHAPIKDLYTFTVKDRVLRELQKFSKRYMDIHLGRAFKSLEVLKTMIGEDR